LARRLVAEHADWLIEGLPVMTIQVLVGDLFSNFRRDRGSQSLSLLADFSAIICSTVRISVKGAPTRSPRA
jgi:uncharacterized membrane protein SirB2